MRRISDETFHMLLHLLECAVSLKTASAVLGVSIQWSKARLGKAGLKARDLQRRHARYRKYKSWIQLEEATQLFLEGEPLLDIVAFYRIPGERIIRWAMVE
jgi:hypothetical protein